MKGAELNMIDVTHEQVTLTDLFGMKLRIPKFQRSYSWESSHVVDLLKDTFERETKYLMGTVILHKPENGGGTEAFDIVDGQQRLVTLTILLQNLGEQNLPLLKQQFSKSSWWYINEAQNTIKNYLAGKSSKKIDSYKIFISEKLLFSKLELSGTNALDLAYTFFDSVNSKGKPLSDFDLLKAHHLMFIPAKEERLAKQHNDEWQSRDDRHKDVFSNTLRRLRMWSQGKDRDSREERADYNEFNDKVEPDKSANHEYKLNRYMQPAAFRSWRREGGKVVLSMDYPVIDAEELIPTEVTQTIEGGDPFFLYARRYHRLYERLYGDNSDNKNSQPESTSYLFVRNLANSIKNDYLQSAFKAVILLYVDKFAEDSLIDVAVCAERIISAWRWEKNSVRIEGTLSHVNNNRLVPIILNAATPRHVISQFLDRTATLEKIPSSNDIKKSNVKCWYRNSLQGFYIDDNRRKISDKRICELTISYQNLEKLND